MCNYNLERYTVVIKDNYAPKAFLKDNSAPKAFLKDNSSPKAFLKDNSAPKAFLKDNSAPKAFLVYMSGDYDKSQLYIICIISYYGYHDTGI